MNGAKTLDKVVEITLLRDLARNIRANDRGYCSAANCVFQFLGVSSNLGGMMDRAANRGCYVGTLVEDVISDRFGAGTVCRLPWNELVPSEPSSGLISSALSLPTRRLRLTGNLPSQVHGLLNDWLTERRNLMAKAALLGGVSRRGELLRRATREAKRADRMLAALSRVAIRREVA